MEKRVDHEKCNLCGTCKRICPLKNIQISDNRVIIGTNCTNCLACMHFCPNAAIGIRNRKVRKEQQYHHPEISTKDLIKR